jgi:hypothetical protein
MARRGRTKATGAARIPSNSSKHAKGYESATRSKHGSRKRNQKTRSSMNIVGSLPLTSGPSISNVNPISLANQPKSKNLAASIYGHSGAENMLNNLISNRKKNASLNVKKGLKKRAQPNQSGKGLAAKRISQATAL